jgi:hypothetical protein
MSHLFEGSAAEVNREGGLKREVGLRIWGGGGSKEVSPIYYVLIWVCFYREARGMRTDFGVYFMIFL